MSRVEFDRSAHLVRLLSTSGDVLAGPFEAYNNVDSHSKGPWPDGSYSYVGYNSHSALSDPDSEYGVYGILIFDVPNRLGMGVHSGRRSIPDGLGREGPAHCTLGCIRTTDEAMAAFVRLVAGDSLQGISVGVTFDVVEAQAAALPVSRKPRRALKSRAVKAARPTGKRTKEPPSRKR
jgi:hypothetical protein